MSENGQLAEEYHPQLTPSPSPLVSPRRSQWNVSRKLLPIKGYYFFFMAGVGVLLPFIALYMMHLGLTSQEMGIIYGIMPFVGFFVRPIVGAISDKYKKHKFVLILVTVLAGVFYFLLVFVPRRPAPPKQSIHTVFMCNIHDSFFMDCFEEEHPTDCRLGLTQLSNTTDFQQLNSSIPCSVSCSSDTRSTLPEFRSCFTNDTGPYNVDRCNGTLRQGSHLDFSIQDLKTLIANEIPRDRSKVGSKLCFDYDIKGILFEQSYTHEALQILCEKELSLSCTVNCKKDILCQQNVLFFDKSFVLFFFIFLLANIVFAPIFPILDAAAYDLLAEDRHMWGKQRVWGSFGFALFAVTSTFIMFMQQQNNRPVEYEVCFYIFLPLCLIAGVIAYFMTMSSDIKCSQFLKNVCTLLCYKEVSAFLFIVMYFGILTGGLEAFLFVYLSGIGSSPLVFGFILLANSVAEVPLLWVAGYIIKKIGLITCLYLALFCYGLRMLVYSFLQEPWFVLFVEPLHGVCFGLMYAAASSYASVIAPPGMSATVQGLLSGVHFGFGKGLGSLITGFMFQGLGERWTWRVYCIVSMVLLVFYVLLNTVVFKPGHRPSTLTPSSSAGRPEVERKQEMNLINSSPNEDIAGVIA